MTAGKIQPGQKRPDRTKGAEQLQQNSHGRKVGMRHLDRTAETGQSSQVDLTGHPGKAREDRMSTI